MAKALEGIRVLDLTRMYGGPLGTMMLAELGADVIKIELPGGGDAIRTTAPLTEGQESYRFISLNRGKRGITLNFHTEEGRRICRELVAKSDVLVENFTPGVMEQFGLGYQELKKHNPGLIYASISGFGHTGPYRHRVAFDTIIQAMGGMISINGFPDAPPTKVGTAIADFLGGIFADIAILAALQHRHTTGEGQFVDVSMQDCVWYLTAIQFLPYYIATGREPPRIGNRQLEVTPFNIYEAKDAHVVIGIVTIGQWHRLLGIIGREDLKDVPEYVSQATRVKHTEEIDAVVGAWTQQRTVAEILEILGAADLACSPIPTFSQVAKDPQLASRQMQVEVEQSISGKLRMPGTVFKMSKTQSDATRQAPFLGQHNFEIYSELMGYDRKTIDRLQREGII
ncbi:MAG: CoA transferase [Chloroflexi bacterium]|nr:CoA transferase [Chloroflexota bacterium]